MYIRKQHQWTEREEVFALIEAHALGAWVCHGADGLIANHMPFVLDRGRGEHGTLMCHVARANPVWRALGAGVPSVVMFRGLQAYITPGWYPGKAEHGKVVPTWNYLAVNAHGTARVVDDPAWLLGLLNRLTHVHETGRPQPWQVGDAPADYIDKLLRAIVGIEIPIDRLEAKCKASQDEAPEDRRGTVEGLRAERREEPGRMAEWVMKALDAGISG